MTKYLINKLPKTALDRVASIRSNPGTRHPYSTLRWRLTPRMTLLIKQTIKVFASVVVSLVIAEGAHSRQPGRMTSGDNPSTAQAADPNISESRVIGQVIEVDQSSNRVILKTDAGNTIIVLVDQKTEYYRVPPGETSLDKAVKITRSEIGSGDKVYARGRISEDRKSLPAQKMIVMLKADIESAQERQRNEWRLRGIAGVVTGLNAKTGEVIVQAQGREGLKTTVITTTESVLFRRYAPDSVKFSDARPGSFAELKIGDHLSALQKKNSTGNAFEAEEVVSGSFRTVVGTVSTADAATGEIKIATLDKNQPLTIVVTRDSVLQRITPQVAAMIARAVKASRQGKQEGGSSTQAPGSSNGDIQRALERLPSLSVSEIQPGVTVAVTSTIGANPSRLTAIKLVTGVDAVLSATQGSDARRNAPGMDWGMPAGVLDPGGARP